MVNIDIRKREWRETSHRVAGTCGTYGEWSQVGPVRVLVPLNPSGDREKRSKCTRCIHLRDAFAITAMHRQAGVAVYSGPT